MKIKTRKLGIKIKLLIPFLVVILFVCMLMCWLLSSKMEQGMSKVGGQVAESVAMASTGKLNVNQIASVIAVGASSSNAETLKESMDAVIDIYDIEYMYLLGGDEKTNTVTYIFDPSDEDNCTGQEYDHDYDYLKKAFEGECMADDYITVIGDDITITAYAPIKQGDQVIAILACDYDASDIKAELNSNTVMAIIIGLICAVVAGIIVFAIITKVVGNLNKVNSKVSELASNEGDLTQSIDVNSGDETELIAENFNELLQFIRSIMLSINENANVLKDSSGKMVSHLGDAGNGITDISATMEEMSAAMEETTASISQIANAIEDMNHQIETIFEQANSGSTSTNDISNKAEEIKNRVHQSRIEAKERSNELAQKVRDSIKKSQAVSEIDSLTEQILVITQQTNLLSLNASIEAARAGEAGRGFAVVAEEIGKLAADSGQAASEIQSVSNSVIRAVSGLANEAENMIAFLDEVTMAGYDELENTSDSYSRDTRMLSDMMKQFAKMSEMLREYSDNIRQSIDDVNTTAEDTANGVSNVTDVTTQMASAILDIENEARSNEEVAAMLKNEVDRFKLN